SGETVSDRTGAAVPSDQWGGVPPAASNRAHSNRPPAHNPCRFRGFSVLTLSCGYFLLILVLFMIILPAFGKVGFITPDTIGITGICRRFHFLTGFCGCFALVFPLFSQLPGSFRVSPGKLNQCIVFSLAFGCPGAGIFSLTLCHHSRILRV